MSRWEIEDAELDELDLDARNVRIVSAGDVEESAIASYMVEAEGVLDLARDILRDGYIDNELPVIVIEGGRRLVLEGNRRITALKLIHDPSLLGASWTRVERMLSRYPDADTPSAIRVMVAPSRAEAQPLLARLHTGRPKKSWLREQQAIFYHAQLSSTVGLDELRTLYPAETANIASFIRMGEMRELIRGLRYADHALERWVKGSQMKMTSFEFAYERPGIQEVLGLKFDTGGRLRTKRLNKAQVRGMMYLLQRIKDGTLNTRSPELKAKASEHEQFVETLRRVVEGEVRTSASNNGDSNSKDESRESAHARGERAGSSGAGASGTGSPQSGGGSDAESSASSPDESDNSNTRNPNRGDTRSRLNMEGFSYNGSSAGMRRRFEELSRLDVREFANATYDFLRTVLECAIKDYFAARGQRLEGQMLNSCLQQLSREYQNDRRMTNLINAVNRKGTMPAGQFAGTALAFNAANHEPDVFAGSREVHEAWERIKPILVEIVGK